jgi:hypothetical protein
VKAVWAELRVDWLPTLFFLVALVVGFLHGWLKLKYKAVWMTFAFDIPIILSLVFVLIGLKRGTRWFPDCGVSTSVKFLIGTAIVWSILPFPVPWLAAVASFRAWCFSPILFILGYHLFRSVRKIELIVWGVLLLGLATAIYGIFFQSEAEVRELMRLNPELELRLMGNFYATSSGSEFRRFSTFVSAAVFGVTMAACTQFASSRFFLPGCSLIERALLLAVAGLCSYAVVLSGSRTSLLLMLASLLLTGFVRRGRLQWLLLPGIAVGALYFGFAASKGGGAGERFGTLLDYDTVSMRVRIVTGPMTDALLSAPFGHGVGSSGYGVPGVLVAKLRELSAEVGAVDVTAADGDLGRLAVDMGLVGLIAYGFMIYHCTRDSLRWMWTLRDSRLGVVGVPAGAWFFMSLVQIPTGSPYLGIPFGPLTWVLLGALRRMIDEYERLQATYGEDVELLPQFASFITPPKTASMFGRKAPAAIQLPPGHRGGAPTVLTAAATAAPGTDRRKLPAPSKTVVRPEGERRSKRFLYRRNDP